MSPLRTGSPLWLAAFAAGLALAVLAGVSGRGGAGAWIAALILGMGLLHHGRVWRAEARGLPQEVRTASTWEEVAPLVEAPRAVLFKHSPVCPVSARAAGEVGRFAGSAAGVPVARIDVLASRPLSDRVARELGVDHESPQVIVLHGGEVHQVLNHGRVQAEALAQAVASARRRPLDDRPLD